MSAELRGQVWRTLSGDGEHPRWYFTVYEAGVCIELGGRCPSHDVAIGRCTDRVRTLRRLLLADDSRPS